MSTLFRAEHRGLRELHATARHLAIGLPVVRSHEPGEEWRWCYVDGLLG